MTLKQLNEYEKDNQQVTYKSDLKKYRDGQNAADARNHKVNTTIIDSGANIAEKKVNIRSIDGKKVKGVGPFMDIVVEYSGSLRNPTEITLDSDTMEMIKKEIGADYYIAGYNIPSNFKNKTGGVLNVVIGFEHNKGWKKITFEK